MQLISFQIKECFGFRDSGRVDLKDPRNLIVTLGRNSSRKISFLTALAHFAPDLIPREHQNFANSNSSSADIPCLIGEYEIGVNGLTLEAGIDCLALEADINDVDPISDALGCLFSAKMNSLSSSSLDLPTRTEYRKLVNKLKDQFIKIYVPFTKSIEQAGKLWVRRTASGAYQFSTDQSFKDADDRLELFSSILTSNKAKIPNIQQWRSIQHLSEEMENLLWRLLVPSLLPTIVEALDAFSESLATRYYSDLLEDPQIEALEKIELIANQFHNAARQLRQRHASRATLTISDEYDVQDLFHTLLRLFFDDIRDEEWTPSYAGGASRVDFLLKQEQVLIEIKMTRTGLTKERDISDQLIIDSERYRVHPDCKVLVAFVYDPEEYLDNPTGLERDLTKATSDVPMYVIIRSH